ncbi:hypothetical protein XU18_4335 [Perkinsela sp. CCAP 1560/4]|nr:hypothetical protein XU18_4335 [Perkinsela sp. CCAP 1560/4]|eukprot:KNH04413.1 hypothetical protein XU18_4335 [Perkinsela sp. CCAP 1560/4]
MDVHGIQKITRLSMATFNCHHFDVASRYLDGFAYFESVVSLSRLCHSHVFFGMNALYFERCSCGLVSPQRMSGRSLVSPPVGSGIPHSNKRRFPEPPHNRVLVQPITKRWPSIGATIGTFGPTHELIFQH